MARQAGRVHGGDERWRWRRSGASSTQAPGGAADRADMHPLLQPLDGRRRSHGPDAFVLRRRQGGAKMVEVPILAGFPLAFAMSPLANQTKNWRNGICVFSPIWRNQLNDNSIPM